MTKEEFLSEFSSDYKEVNDVYNRYQNYIFTECLDKSYDSNYYILDEPSFYLLDYIIKHHNVIYEVVNNVFNVDDPELDENLDTIVDSLDFTEMFSLYEFSINVNITILINRLTDILIDLDLYKEVDIDKYYVESVLNKILPYKITTYEFN